MPDISINRKTLTFNNIYYTDSLYGNDTTGTGTVSNPFKTLAKAIATCNVTGDAIFLKNRFIENITNLNKSISFIGDYYRYGSYIQGTWGGVSTTPYVNLNFYCVYMIQIVTTTPMFTYCNVNFHNCYISDANTTNSEYYGTYNHFNCFITALGTLTQGAWNFVNCAWTIAGKGNRTNNIESIAVANYNANFFNLIGSLIGSPTYPWQNMGTNKLSDGTISVISGKNPDNTIAHIGLYGGDYAWNWTINLSLLEDSTNKVYTANAFLNNYYPQIIDTGTTESIVTKATFDTYGLTDTSFTTKDFTQLVLLPKKENAIDVGYQFRTHISISKITAIKDINVIDNGIKNFGTYRGWSDGTYARSANEYKNPVDGLHSYTGATGDGVYRIQPNPSVSTTYDILCDMTTDGGGWSMVGFVGTGIYGYYSTAYTFNTAGTVLNNQSEVVASGNWHLKCANNLLCDSAPYTQMAICLDNKFTQIGLYEASNKVVYYKWEDMYRIHSSPYDAIGGNIWYKFKATDAWSRGYMGAISTAVWQPYTSGGANLIVQTSSGTGWYWGSGCTGGTNTYSHYGYTWIR